MEAIGNSPYCLVYGKEDILPANLTTPSLQLPKSIQQDDSSPLQWRIDTLIKLEEDREKEKNNFYQHQQLVKKWFDENSSSNTKFSIGDLVLRWDKQHKYNKEYTEFQHLWLGPFIITKNIGPITVQLQTLEGAIDTYPVNVFLLKKYFFCKFS